MCFAPLFFFVSIAAIFHTILYILEVFTGHLDDENNKQWVLFLEGFIDDIIQFYLFYMGPIQVARLHRLTQEVTPAGTLISINLIISLFVGDFIRVFSIFIFKDNLKLN